MTMSLRNLYLARFGFAVVWAALIVATGSGIGAVSGILLVLYPAVDAAAAVVDLRSSRSTKAARLLRLNLALSAATTIGLAVAVSAGVPAVLRVWGAWAITTGLVQLAVALGRRGLDGQLPMLLSGGISVLAGGAFVGMASADDPQLTSLGGYALLGGIFFLASALRLDRRAAATTP